MRKTFTTEPVLNDKTYSVFCDIAVDGRESHNPSVAVAGAFAPVAASAFISLTPASGMPTNRETEATRERVGETELGGVTKCNTAKYAKARNKRRGCVYGRKALHLGEHSPLLREILDGVAAPRRGKPQFAVEETEAVGGFAVRLNGITRNTERGGDCGTAPFSPSEISAAGAAETPCGCR